jgi:acyl-CoA hydrolase
MTPRRKAAEEPQKKLESLQMTPASKPAEPAIADQGMLVRRAPKQWLQAIAELRRQGRISEADAELAEFKRQYPHHPFDLDRPTP